jgi:CheY-like chemotaxis protein
VRVLVVDDDAVVRRAISRLLGRSGCTVVEAADGVEAVDAVRAGGCDLIVSDLRMPRMDGWELLEWLAAEVPELLPRVVLLSGDGGGDSEIRTGGVAVPLLAKPYVPEALLRVVERVAGVRLQG